MTKTDELKKRIQTIFTEQFEDEKFEWNKNWSDYCFSSIQLIYFLKDLEAEFGAIPLAEFYELQSGTDLLLYLEKRSR